MKSEKNAKDHRFEAVPVLGHGMLFTPAFLDPDTIPKGVYLYAVRHHSEDPEKPIQIAAWAVVNRYGSLLTTTPIQLRQHPKLNNSFKELTTAINNLGDEMHVFMLELKKDRSAEA